MCCPCLVKVKAGQACIDDGPSSPDCRITRSQLPHSYYFITRILVLKFVNKGVFFEEIQDWHFPRKSGYFGTDIREFGEKGVNFDVQCFNVKMGVHLV